MDQNHQNIQLSKTVFKSVFFNWPTPASFSFIFGLFKQPIQFLQQINVKNVQVSIQYMAPGFEPKPYEHDLSPTTTRSGLPPNPL